MTEESPYDALMAHAGKGMLTIIVKTNKKNFRIISFENNEFTIELSSRPIDNKANMELLRELKKLTGLSFEIISGRSSRRKVLRKLPR